MDNIDRNLFILTGVGQLRNITGFINQYNATNNFAIILYTEKNLDIVNNIQKAIEDAQFCEVQFVKLPNKLLDEKKEKSILIYNILMQQINKNIETNNIKNLFLCSFSNYYVFFEKIIRNKKVTINLLEEGLTTYRVYQEEIDKKNCKIKLTDILNKIKNIFKKFYIIIRPIVLFLKAIIELLITILSFICRINFIYYIRKAKKKMSKYKYGVIEKFDNTYVCYPELIKKLNKNIGQVHKLNLNYKDENVKFTSNDDKENVLFINQKYGIKYKDHFPIIFSIFRDMGLKKVYIKFHPKEEMENFKEIFEEAKAQYPEIEIITLNEYNHIPVENLINSNNITKIIALTSSSLFYSKLVNDKLEVISIAEEYRKRCIKKAVSNKRMKAFLKDYEMMDRLFKIKQFEYKQNEENNANGGEKNEQECSIYTS